MWTMYNIHSDLYWNEKQRCWCTIEKATRYTAQQRYTIPLPSLFIQWRFVAAFHRAARDAACADLA